MLFNTFSYMVFFIVTIAVYFILPYKFRPVWLLGTSYYFYGSWNAKYVLLMLAVTLISYLAAIIIRKGHNIGLVLGVGLCTLLLVVFKYSNFLISNLNSLINVAFSGKGNIPLLDIVLPVGISFYCFQAISYIIDVYRDHECIETNFIRYALYISFFPQLVAGPIERGDRIIKQLRDMESGRLKFNYQKFTDGLQWIAYGLFLKMVIADRVSILVDYVYDGFRELSAFALILGMIGFSIQIYCDFAGYSYIACGSALVTGVEIVENFKAPYFSKSIAEFWRRWHISLSTWFRDYVYIPLGGNRCSELRNATNVMLTMLLSGLWHGASWHFVAWGGIHGIAQVVQRLWEKRFGKKKDLQDSFWIGASKTVAVSMFVSIAWVFFRANSLKDAVNYLSRAFSRWDITWLFSGEIYNLGLNVIELNILIVAILIMWGVDRFNYKQNEKEYELVNRQGIVFKWIFNLILIVFVVLFGVYGSDGVESAFLYFQF